jgi:superoxide dismutase, Cu-Zn family
VPRYRSIAVAALAASALALTPGAAYAQGVHDHGISDANSEAFSMLWAHYRGGLVDLRPTTTEPLDGATASATMVGLGGVSHFTLRVKGIDESADGRTFGAHLHMGPCVAGDYAGLTGLGHYNTDILAAVQPPAISQQTEVWLDFKVNPGGEARVKVAVPFVPEPGTRSIVVHADPTNSVGKAGDRLACLPLTINQLSDAPG